MLVCGGKVTAVDPAVFYWPSQQNGLFGLHTSHVDDFICAGEQNFDESSVLQKIHQSLSVG